jgi:hypothetical protein
VREADSSIDAPPLKPAVSVSTIDAWNWINIAFRTADQVPNAGLMAAPARQ